MKKLFLLSAICAILSSCGNNNSGNDKTAATKAKVQRFYEEVINAHNPAAVDSFCTTDFTNHNPSPGHAGKGSEDLKAEFKDFFTMFPDVHMTVNGMTTSGDTVMTWITMSGTNSGAGQGMPATNKPFNVMGTDVLIIKDGKASDRWGYNEDMKMMAQLGLMPAPGAPAPDASVKK